MSLRPSTSFFRFVRFVLHLESTSFISFGPAPSFVMPRTVSTNRELTAGDENEPSSGTHPKKLPMIFSNNSIRMSPFCRSLRIDRSRRDSDPTPRGHEMRVTGAQAATINDFVPTPALERPTNSPARQDIPTRALVACFPFEPPAASLGRR